MTPTERTARGIRSTFWGSILLFIAAALILSGVCLYLAACGCSTSQPSHAWRDASGEHSISHEYRDGKIVEVVR